MFFQKKLKHEHEHDYKMVASQNEIITERKWTHILWQCECGEWYVDTIPGSWTTDEIKLLK